AYLRCRHTRSHTAEAGRRSRINGDGLPGIDLRAPATRLRRLTSRLLSLPDSPRIAPARTVSAASRPFYPPEPIVLVIVVGLTRSQFSLRQIHAVPLQVPRKSCRRLFHSERTL